MRYVSPRGSAPPVGFVDAVLDRLSPDCGLYVPETWPQFSPAQIAAFADLSYPQVAAQVIGAFAGDEIAPEVLLEMCRAAYATFTHAAVAPLVQLRPGVFMAELFHGPSLAFKAVALQLLARPYDHLLGSQGRVPPNLCAPAGDTGSAAGGAVRGRQRADE